MVVESKNEKINVYECFMLALCTYVLATLVVTTFAKLSPDVITILETVDTAVCFLFLGDFFYKLFTAESKLGYLKWGWIDFISSIPVVDPLQWGRFARVIRILRLLRGVRSIKYLVTFLLHRRAASAFSTALFTSLLMVVFSSVAVLDFERDDPNANIQTPEDALWWACCTITSVGYGDLYPITLPGRMVGVASMVCGIAVFGIFAGFVASWFLAPQEAEQEDELEEIRHRLTAIEGHLSKLVSQTDDSFINDLAAIERQLTEIVASNDLAENLQNAPPLEVK